MKKRNLLLLLPVVLCACSNAISTSTNITTSSSIESNIVSNTSLSNSSVGNEITASLKEVMMIYAQLGNYTYVVNDEVFNVVTTLRYTKNAYYYQPSTEEHGGSAIGYAENSKGVFDYTINENGEIEFGSYLTSSNGEYVTGLWFNTLVSFLDIDLNALPDEPIQGTNRYVLQGDNKFLVSALAGFGDTVLQQKIDVYIELTSNTTFKTIIYTGGLPESYRGYIYGELFDVGTTTIPEIEKILLNDQGPEDLNTSLLDLLKQLKNSKNYTITLSGASNYIDSFTSQNYYSKNLDNDSLSKGYARSADGVFTYRIVDNVVIPGEAISDGGGGVFDNFWGSLPNFFSFETMNLARLTYEVLEDNKYNINSNTIINTFADVSHIGNANVNENSSLIITANKNNIEFVLSIDENTIVNGVVDKIDETSISEIEDFMNNGGGPLVYPTIDDKARDLLFNLSKAKNYTLEIVSTYFKKQFSLEKKFTATGYYQSYADNSDNFGYIQSNSGIDKFTYDNNNQKVLGDKVAEEGSFLWSSNLFKGMNSIDSAAVEGKKIDSNLYTITDNTTRSSLYSIANLTQNESSEAMFYIESATMEITNNETNEAIFTLKFGKMGATGEIKIIVKNVGNTIIL